MDGIKNTSINNFRGIEHLDMEDFARVNVLVGQNNCGKSTVLDTLPNNHDAGTLEDLLENIINPNNRPIFDCWEHYEQELVQIDIPGRTPPPLTTPAKKTKIYGYLEALLGETKSQKELIKEANRNYEDTQHWNLDAEYLEPLKAFLENNIKLPE
ncbi:MAG: AAA family ATPase [Bacteroidales bacterium]|nr:AAA family ATPase [Bacteroidales bacterium]